MTDVEHIRNYYGVDATPGTRVRYAGNNPAFDGKIVPQPDHSNAAGQYIFIEFDAYPGEVYGPFHATWNIEYLDGQLS